MLDAIDCWHSIANSTNSTFVRKTTINECRFSKTAGFILLFISIILFIINIYSLLTIKKNHQISSRDRNLVIGMFLSSLYVIIISVPSVVTQCLLCRRLCSGLIFRIEGFNSFFNSYITMYMLVALSIVRYLTTANSLIINPIIYIIILKNREMTLVISNEE